MSTQRLVYLHASSGHCKILETLGPHGLPRIQRVHMCNHRILWKINFAFPHWEYQPWWCWRGGGSDGRRRAPLRDSRQSLLKLLVSHVSQYVPICLRRSRHTTLFLFVKRHRFYYGFAIMLYCTRPIPKEDNIAAGTSLKLIAKGLGNLLMGLVGPPSTHPGIG